MRTATALLLAALATSFGCRQRDLTLSVDAVTREYPQSNARAHDAAREAAEALQLKILRDRGDELVAVDPQGLKTTVLFQEPARGGSRVLVHVEPGDVDAAARFHEQIAHELGISRAREGLLGMGGGESVTVESPLGLHVCRRSAHRTFKALDFLLTAETLEQGRARLDGRRYDSMPMAIVMASRHDGGTKVTFIAGTERSAELRQTVLRMREEFFRGIQP